jgi:CxxC motif-containing protein (DUF1111 family)
MKTVFKSIYGAALLLSSVGCGGDDALSSDAAVDGSPSSSVFASDVPINGLTGSDVAQFDKGDDLFDLVFREPDGLGPLYVRTSCGACHSDGSRGPGLVQKMSVVEADGVTASADQSELLYGHSIREGLVAPAVTPVVPPPGDSNVRVSVRVGPPVLGRGYLEAIDDSEIERVEALQAARTDAIHGKINRVTYISVPVAGNAFNTFTQGQTGIIGRFGLKARQPSIDDFAADAYQGDMGLTTPMRPVELPNPDGLTDDSKVGVDLDQSHIDRVAFYMRRIAIPVRVGLTDAGAALFDQAKCSACHVPSLHTRADYPIAQLADIDAPVFTDMLLHDMGTGLADGLADQSSDGKSWRTSPLIGERFAQTFLHDGRASTIAEAIAAHGGEGSDAAAAFSALSAADQQTLTDYVGAL